MLFTAAILGIFVYGMIAAMLGTILPDLSKKYSLSPKQNGNIALIQAIGLMIGSFFSGPLMDLYGKQVGMLLGLGLVALALLSLRSVRGYAPVATAMLVLGLGGGVLVTGANGMNSEIANVLKTNTSSISNLLNLFFGLGGLITPLVAANLFKSDSKKLTLFAAVLAVVALVVNAIAPYYLIPKALGKISFNFKMATSLLTDPHLMLPALLLFLYVACEVGVWNWLARHLIAQGVSEKRAMTILSLGFALGLIVGRVMTWWVLQHVDPETVNPKSILLGAAVAMALTTYLMLQSKSPTVAWIAIFVGGLAMAPVFPTALGYVSDAFKPAHLETTALGIAITAGWAGIVASSPIIGGIAGNDPTRLKKALLLLPAASVIMAVVAFMLPVLPKIAK
jgi:fucose permease